MTLTMTLVERRETVYKGKPQVKLTLVDSSIADAYTVAAPNLKTFPPVTKFTVYLRPEDATGYFGDARAGSRVEVGVSPLLQPITAVSTRG